MRKLFFIFTIFVTTLSTGCGKSQFKEFSSPDGRFSILMYGKPRKEEMHFGSYNMTMYGNASDGEEYAAGSADVQQNLPDMMYSAFMDGVVGSFNEGNAGNISSRGSVSNGHGLSGFRVLIAQIRRQRLWPQCSSPADGSICATRVEKDAHQSNPVGEVIPFDSFKLTDGETPGKNEGESTDFSLRLRAVPCWDPPARPRPTNRSLPANSITSRRQQSSPTPAEPLRDDQGRANGRPDPGGNNVDPPEPGRPGVVNDPPMPGRPGRGPNRPNRGDQPQMVGFGIGPEFQDSAPEGGLLVGFDIGFRLRSQQQRRYHHRPPAYFSRR